MSDLWILLIKMFVEYLVLYPSWVLENRMIIARPLLVQGRDSHTRILPV